MAIKLNFNICDNSSECSGIAVCPTGALYWDEEALNPLSEKGCLCVDNEKCISCGNCVGEDGCPVGAIVFANSEDELEKLAEDCKTDLTKVEGLFVERYGAAAIDESLCVSFDELETLIESKSGIILVEKFADWSIQCLLSSIPIDIIVAEIKTITGMDDISFSRVDITEKVEEGSDLPTLDIYQRGKVLCHIQGYMDNTQLDELRDILHGSLRLNLIK